MRTGDKWVLCAVLALTGCDVLLGLEHPLKPSVDAAAGADVEIDARSDGLVAWFEMDDMGSGQPCARDSTGHHHDGTCSGNVGLVPGKIGGAFSFDGSAAIDVPHASELDTLDAFTIALWFQIASAPSMTGCAFDRPLGMNGQAQQVCVDTTDVEFGVSNAAATISPLPTFNEWHHATLTWSFQGTVMSVWLDGFHFNTTTPSATFDANDLWIGGDRSQGSLRVPYTGYIDDLRIYNRVLSDAEIMSLEAP